MARSWPRKTRSRGRRSRCGRCRCPMRSRRRRCCAPRFAAPRSPPPVAFWPERRPSPPCAPSAPSARSHAPRAASRRRRDRRERRRQPLLPRRRPPARPLTAGRWAENACSVRNRPADLEVEVRPASPYALPRGSDDRTLWIQGGVATRLLHVGASPVLVRAWQPAADRVVLRAEAVDPGRVTLPLAGDREPVPAGAAELELAIERMRFVLGVDLRPRRVPPSLPPRPSGRAADPPHAGLPAAAPGLALGGARGGGGRAADRGRARGHDRAPHRRPLGAADRRGARGAARRPGGGDDRRPRAGRTGLDGPRPDPGGGAAAGGEGRRRRPLRSRLAGDRPAAAGAAADRPLDGPVPGPVRPRRDGLAAGRRPRLHQAGRPPRRARPPRHVSPRWRSSTRRTSPTGAWSARSPWPACTGSWPRARRCASPPERGRAGLHEFVPGRSMRSSVWTICR